MMSEDSNGESTFEIVDGKGTSQDEVSSLVQLANAQTVPPQLPAPGNTFLMGSPAPMMQNPPAFENNPGMSPVAMGTQPDAFVPAPPMHISPSYQYAASQAVASASVDLEPESATYIAPGSYSNASAPTTGAGAGFFGWIRESVGGHAVLSKVAEKARSGMNSVMMTLDPQMKEYLTKEESPLSMVNLVVASDKESKVGPIRDAFSSSPSRLHFSVSGMGTQAVSIAAQPVGAAKARKACEERIGNLRRSGMVDSNAPIIALENFIIEMLPGQWYDMGCLVLEEPGLKEGIQVFTQGTPIPYEWVQELREGTPHDYPPRWSGLAITIGQVAAKHLQVPQTEWHRALTGMKREDMIFAAARVLVGLYLAQRSL